MTTHTRRNPIRRMAICRWTSVLRGVSTLVCPSMPRTSRWVATSPSETLAASCQHGPTANLTKVSTQFPLRSVVVVVDRSSTPDGITKQGCVCLGTRKREMRRLLTLRRCCFPRNFCCAAVIGCNRKSSERLVPPLKLDERLGTLGQGLARDFAVLDQSTQSSSATHESTEIKTRCETSTAIVEEGTSDDGTREERE